MLCPYCNSVIPDNAVQCTCCGNSLVQNGYNQQGYPQQNNTYYQTPQPNGMYQNMQMPQYPQNGYATPDKASKGLVVLSFFFPIIGLILGVLSYVQNKAASGKSYIKAAVIGFIIAILFTLFYCIALPIIAMSGQ